MIPFPAVGMGPAAERRGRAFPPIPPATPIPVPATAPLPVPRPQPPGSRTPLRRSPGHDPGGVNTEPNPEYAHRLAQDLLGFGHPGPPPAPVDSLSEEDERPPPLPPPSLPQIRDRERQIGMWSALAQEPSRYGSRHDPWAPLAAGIKQGVGRAMVGRLSRDLDRMMEARMTAITEAAERATSLADLARVQRSLQASPEEIRPFQEAIVAESAQRYESWRAMTDTYTNVLTKGILPYQSQQQTRAQDAELRRRDRVHAAQVAAAENVLSALVGEDQLTAHLAAGKGGPGLQAAAKSTASDLTDQRLTAISEANGHLPMSADTFPRALPRILETHEFGKFQMQDRTFGILGDIPIPMPRPGAEIAEEDRAAIDEMFGLYLAGWVFRSFPDLATNTDALSQLERQSGHLGLLYDPRVASRLVADNREFVGWALDTLGLDVPVQEVVDAGVQSTQPATHSDSELENAGIHPSRWDDYRQWGLNTAVDYIAGLMEARAGKIPRFMEPRRELGGQLQTPGSVVAARREAGAWRSLTPDPTAAANAKRTYDDLSARMGGGLSAAELRDLERAIDILLVNGRI